MISELLEIGTRTLSLAEQSLARHRAARLAALNRPSTSSQMEPLPLIGDEDDAYLVDETVDGSPLVQPEFFPPSSSAQPQPISSVPTPQLDDFKTEYHPHSGKTDLIQSFEEFRTESFPLDPASLDDKPWRPFKCRADFEFAEVALEGGLKQSQIETLLRLIGDISSGKVEFTLRSYGDLKNSWAEASKRLTPVSS